MSSAAEAFALGNLQFVEENYDDALQKFTLAVELEPSSATYLLHRCSTYLKLLNFFDALADANNALKLAPGSSLGHKYKGMALFSMEEFHSASKSFEAALEIEQREGKNIAPLKTWLRKCNAEKEFEQAEQSPTSMEMDTAAAPQPIPAVASAPVPAPVDHGFVSRPRYEWLQGQTSVTVTVFAKNITAEQAKISITPTELTICLKLSASSEYALDFTLFNAIEPSTSTVTHSPMKVTIMLTKVNQQLWWPCLEAPNDGTPAVSSVQPMPTTPADSAPNSAPKPFAKKNWDKIASDAVKKIEEEEKDTSLDKFFQQIYGDASEEARRAMNKSYVESGGTVLSTNWADVGSKKVEAPPDSKPAFKPT